MFGDCEKQKAPLWLPSVLDELAGSPPGTEKGKTKKQPDLHPFKQVLSLKIIQILHPLKISKTGIEP